MKNLLLGLSFVNPGIYISVILYTESSEVDPYLTFVWASVIYQCLYLFRFRKDELLSFWQCAAKLVLYYTITVQIVVIINVSRIFNHELFVSIFGPIVWTHLSTANRWGIGQADIITIVALCVVYQIAYSMYNKLRR